jgi:hypothetical protein
MKKGQKLPPDHHVVRYVPWSKLRRDENDNVLGVLGEAFRRRDEEKALSATWLEYFSGDRDAQVTGAVQTVVQVLKPEARAVLPSGMWPQLARHA